MQAFLSFALSAALLASASGVRAQSADDGGDLPLTEEDEDAGRDRETVDIEPYTGPPVFLPQDEAPPPATEVSSQLVKEQYKDLGTPHFERRLVRYSDDSYVSDGPHKEFYATGQLFVEGEFDKSRASGEWTFYHPNGAVAKRVQYADGLPTGKVEVLDDQGRLKEVRSYLDGERDGEWAVFAYDDGEKRQRSQSTYRAGERHGEWKVWYTNGQLRQMQSYVDGKLEGEAAEWSRSGEKRLEANFKAGKREGKAVIYRRDGGVVTRVYEDDRLVEQQETGGAG